MRPGTDDLINVRELLGGTAGRARALVDALFDQEKQVTVPEFEAEVGPDDARTLINLELVGLADGCYEPLVRIDRVGGMFIASDLRLNRRQADFVVGPGPASFLLARHVRRPRGGSTLDLGCGSGIQGLLLAGAGPVEALDINPRALAFARFNAALNGLRGLSVAGGDFLAEDADKGLDSRFDTVVANPPFVLAPRQVLTYRDRSLPGDLVGRRTVERVGRALAPGGRGYVLCNWIDRAEDWAEPVRSWVEPLGVDAFVLRVGSHEPEEYAAIWTHDLPAPARAHATAIWARALRAEGVGRIHVGLVALGRPTRRRQVRIVAVDRPARPVTGRDMEDFLGSGHGAERPGIQRRLICGPPGAVTDGAASGHRRHTARESRIGTIRRGRRMGGSES